MWGLLRLTTQHKLVKQFSVFNQSDYKIVYKFPYVRGIGVINRLKLYQTVLTCIALPSSTVLNQLGVLSLDDVLFTTIVGLTGIIPLFGFGYFANKLVGIIYLSDKSNLVKFAYLDFWGNRKDMIIPLNEIVPFAESKTSLTDILYLKVRQFSSKNTMKLCTKYGIIDDEGFNKIFNS